MTASPPSRPTWADPGKLLQWSGFLGFNVEFIAWVFFGKPDPTLMGICGMAASGGYLANAIGTLRQGPPDSASSTPPPPPPPPTDPGTAA